MNGPWLDLLTVLEDATGINEEPFFCMLIERVFPEAPKVLEEAIGINLELPFCILIEFPILAFITDELLGTTREDVVDLA